MNRRLIVSGFLLAAVSLLVGAVLTFMAVPQQAAAQAENPDSRTIQVSGRGEVSAEPDQAIVRLGVETEADTAAAALDDNNDRMTAVISATLEAGIAEEDIQTQGFNLRPVYETQDDGQPQLSGYRASNIVQVTVRDMDGLGQLLDATVAAGSNNIESIQFEVSNRLELETAAREAAMNDAQQKAEQLTQLAGAELGPVHTIVETGGASPVPAAAAQQESLAGAVPIQPGTQTIQASVRVTWEIQ